MIRIDWIHNRVSRAEYYMVCRMSEGSMKKCNFCGNKHVREAQVQYIYRHDEKFLIVNNVPCEQCEFCGEKYFKAQVLRNIELDFKKIHSAGKKAKKEPKVLVEEYFELQKASRKIALTGI